MTREHKKIMPVVKVDVHGHKGVWIFTFWCPFCKRKHQHGGGNVSGDYREYLGHRVDHCGDSRSPFKETGYVLRLNKKPK